MIDEENLSKYISQKIKTLRENAGFTVNSLAYRSGISQSYLRDIEIGNKCNISVEKLFKICLEVGVTLEDFFSDDLHPTSPDPLIQKINSMSQEQHDKLLDFLNSVDM